jgi:hypothetical protein
MDVVTDEESIGIRFDEVFIPSAFCEAKGESEVSLFCGGFVVYDTYTRIFCGSF